MSKPLKYYTHPSYREPAVDTPTRSMVLQRRKSELLQQLSEIATQLKAIDLELAGN